MGVISAILFKLGPPDPELARSMLDVAKHYDGERAVAICGACAIGAANGTDLNDSVVSAHGAWMAAFSGKLDNMSELAGLMSEMGFRPAGSNAADLVVASFRALGASAPARFRGVFAAAVTNGNELWCFRDQLGIRSVHFHDHPHRFVVASEAKQVIVGAGLRREPNMQVLETILYARMKYDTPAALAGVERLPQATVLHVDGSGRSTRQRYWNPPELFEKSGVTVADVSERFAGVFETAVARCLTGKDVVSLSGGIDSPAVAGFAAPLFLERTGRPLPALSTVYPDHPRVDESGYIRRVADYLGMELTTFTPTAGPWDNLEHWVTVLDGPSPTLSLDEVTEYNRIAHGYGFRNILGGDIAEAVFNINRHVIGHLFAHGRWKALAAMWRAVRGQGTTAGQFAKYMASPFIPGRLLNWYLHRTGRDFPQRIPDWLSAAKVNEVPFRADLIPPGRDRYRTLQLYPFEGMTLTLEAADVAAQLSGVTTRSPFADVDVIEFFVGLPAEVKFPDLGSKTLMRRMLRGRVPDEILNRKDKTVFGDYIMAHLNYDVLRRYLVNPPVRMAGVNYERLAERVERRELKLIDYAWANDLVRIHVFLSQW